MGVTYLVRAGDNGNKAAMVPAGVVFLLLGILVVFCLISWVPRMPFSVLMLETSTHVMAKHGHIYTTTFLGGIATAGITVWYTVCDPQTFYNTYVWLLFVVVHSASIILRMEQGWPGWPGRRAFGKRAGNRSNLLSLVCFLLDNRGIEEHYTCNTVRRPWQLVLLWVFTFDHIYLQPSWFLVIFRGLTRKLSHREFYFCFFKTKVDLELGKLTSLSRRRETLRIPQESHEICLFSCHDLFFRKYQLR